MFSFLKNIFMQTLNMSGDAVAVLKKKIAKSLNFSHLAQSQQEQIIDLLLGVVSSKIYRKVQHMLNQEQRQELSLQQRLPARQLMQYLQKEVPGFEQLVEEVTLEVVSDFRQKRRKLAGA
jgi:hypothetical protein